jgi:hypothetical protein
MTDGAGEAATNTGFATKYGCLPYGKAQVSRLRLFGSLLGRPGIGPKRNGGRHRCQPPLRRAKDMPVFATWSALTFRPSRPALDPGSPAQASLSIRQLPPGEEPDRSTRLRGPKVRWSFDRSGLSRRNPIPRNWNSPVKTARCSAALLGSTTLASRFVLHIEMLRTASRSRKIDSSGASSRLAPAKARKPSSLPAGGDRIFAPCRTFLPLPAFR